MDGKEIKILIGIVLLLMGFGVISLGKILSVLMVIFGAYLIYSGLKKK